MMTRLYSSTVLGVDGVEVEVEVDFRPMAEKRTFIVGLPDAAVKESGQRVDTAIQNSGLPFQQGVFVVNLAPADLRKQGPGFDLPIALGMVAGAAERDMDASSWCIVGELGPGWRRTPRAGHSAADYGGAAHGQEAHHAATC